MTPSLRFLMFPHNIRTVRAYVKIEHRNIIIIIVKYKENTNVLRIKFQLYKNRNDNIRLFLPHTNSK